MIDFSTLQGLTIPEGVVTQIADASGRVLWRSTIKFTINGDTYIADRGMTWAEWFASDYNTTGETEGTITDSNGNEVSMDAVIVGGTVYEVGFDNGMRKITVTRGYTFDGYEGSVYLSIGNALYYDNGDCYAGDRGNWTSPTTIEVPVGTQIGFSVERGISKGEVILNGTVVFEKYDDYAWWGDEYTVTKNVTLALTRDWYGQSLKYTLTITEE